MTDIASKKVSKVGIYMISVGEGITYFGGIRLYDEEGSIIHEEKGSNCG